jgi:peptidoglycan/LPS O-acetylase OafA/YrhL
VAVVAVVAYHLGRLQGGFLGVDVFFAISGFLITRLLLAERERTGTVDLRGFWIRRFRRLLPALLVVLVAVLLGSKRWLPSWRLGDIRDDALGALFYVANWRFVLSGQSYFQSGVAPSPLRHTWSLAIEEQFYVLWPLVVAGVGALALRRSGRRSPRSACRRAVASTALAFALVSGAWTAWAAARGFDRSRLYYGTDSRLFTLCLGAWLATWFDPAGLGASGDGVGDGRRSRRGGWAIAAVGASTALGVLFVVARTEDVRTYRGGLQLTAVVAVVAVAGLATGVGPVARVLASAVPRWIGRRSYGLYLWSWPVQVFAAEHLRWEGLRLDGFVVAVSTVLAAASFWLVEEPIRTGQRPVGLPRRMPPTVGPRRRPAALVPAAAVMAVAVLAVVVAVGAPPAPAYLRVDDRAVEQALAGVDRSASPSTTTTAVGAPTAAGPFDAGAPALVDPTATGDPTAVHGRTLRVMIAGDSVGWSLGWDLGADAVPGVTIEDRAIIACGIMAPEGRYIAGDRAPNPYHPACADLDRAEAAGLAAHPDVVLLWLGAWEVYDQDVDGRRYDVGDDDYAALLESRLQQRIDRYRAAGVPTILPLVPCMSLGASYLGSERIDADRRAWVDARVRAVAARNPGWVRIIDPTSVLCADDGTPRATTPDGLPLRQDGVHFDGPTARWFWRTWLAGQVAAAFARA